jgi:thymidylate kinase
MIAINIRGTSGSGKSTLVRAVMLHYAVNTPCFVEGRKQPHHYILSREDRPCLVVPGHYATPCGGCDTLKTVNDVYETVNLAVAAKSNVLYEGIMVADDTRRAIDLNAAADVHVILLTTPIETCLASIQARRAARGDVRELNPKKTVVRAKTHENGCWRLEAEGVPVYRLDRDAALAKVKELLNL